MVNYTFINDRGWKVTEYRPFSASYAILHSPCIRDYASRSGPDRYGDNATSAHDAAPQTAAQPDNLVQKLTGQQLRFDYSSLDVLRQMLEERVAIRNRNRSSILGSISDVSGDIYSASLIKTQDGDRRRQGLEKTKLDLERELRETDERLWKDTAEIRETLVTAARKFDGTYLRSSIFTSPFNPKGLLEYASPTPSPTLHDDKRKGQGYTGISG